MHALVESERAARAPARPQALWPRRESCSGQRWTEERRRALEALGGERARGEWVYRTATAELEAELAGRVDDLVRGKPNPRLREDRPGRAAPTHPLTCRPMTS